MQMSLIQFGSGKFISGGLQSREAGAARPCFEQKLQRMYTLKRNLLMSTYCNSFTESLVVDCSKVVLTQL